MAEIKKWNGINNLEAPERLKMGQLATGVDVDIDNTNRVRTRMGFTQINATACHSLYANSLLSVLVQDKTLKRINDDLSLTTVTTLSTAAQVSFDTVGNFTFYSNGIDTGKFVGVNHSKLGVAVPVGQPAATAIPGSLPPGRYQYALTFLRADGHESGTGPAGYIDLPEGGGIFFSDIEVSTNTEVSGKMVYLSSPNGETMYRAIEVLPGATSALYTGDGMDLREPLTTQFAGPPPAGTIIRVYNGCLYVVVHDTVYYSDPYNFELFRLDSNFLRFPGKVGMFESVNNGLYVATVDAEGQESEGGGDTWFLGGTRPDELKSVQVYDYGVIEGTAVRTVASVFSEEDKVEQGSDSRPAVVWTTRWGVCMGLDGGVVENMTESKYSFPSASRGHAIVRAIRGYDQYLVTLQGPGSNSNQYS